MRYSYINKAIRQINEHVTIGHISPQRKTHCGKSEQFVFLFEIILNNGASVKTSEQSRLYRAKRRL